MEKILEGRTAAGRAATALKRQIARLSVKPKLAILQIGDRLDSTTYIRQKLFLAEKIGAEVLHQQYPANASATKIFALIKKWNTDPSIHGVIVQLPLPASLRPQTNLFLNAVAPTKDVDCLGATRFKSFLAGEPGSLMPATTKAILTLLGFHRVTVTGKKVLIIGNSLLVGKPTAFALLDRGATVTLAHRHTDNLPARAAAAEILITATGHKNLIRRGWINPKQIIIDVGGDLHPEVIGRVAALSPTPGGVGPLTVVSLFENLLLVARKTSILPSNEKF